MVALEFQSEWKVMFKQITFLKLRRNLFPIQGGVVIPLITPRKEVIHPLLPERIPCYDLALIADLTLGGLTSCEFKTPTSGTANFAHLTGGVYKERERIHRDLLIRDYYRFRLHGGELQPPI